MQERVAMRDVSLLGHSPISSCTPTYPLEHRLERGPGEIADGRLARKALGEHPCARRPVRFARLATDQSDAGLGWISVRVKFIPKNEARVADA